MANAESMTRGTERRNFLIVLVLAVGAAFFVARSLFDLPNVGGGLSKITAEELVIVTPPIPVRGDWNLESAETGKQMQLESLRGKVVFLNTWATWCPPCVAEIPSIEALYGKFRDNPNVAFVLATDEVREDVKAFLETNKHNVPVYHALQSPSGVLESSAIPVTFILDKELKVRVRQMGAWDWDTEAAANFLHKLAAEAGDGPKDTPSEAKTES